MLDDTQLRLVIFISVLMLMAILEAIIPKRQRTQKRWQRWPTNLGLVLINSTLLKLLSPIAAITVADYAMDNHWSLLSFSPLPLPLWVEIIIAIVLLDFAIYLQHVLSHRIPILWRFHKVHHADRDIDVTTGVRFHPVEIIISMIYKCGVIVLLGPITLAVMIFEIVLNASAMFNHANVYLPKTIDNILRLAVITPDFHRVHHSTTPKETNSNYGFFLSIWDRLCRTYIPQPSMQHDGMTIGLSTYQTQDPASIRWCLQLPFKRIVSTMKQNKE